MTDGVIYVATGADYTDLAVMSAKSLRAFNPSLPIDIFTDVDRNDLSETFDAVHLIDDPHQRSKIDCIPRSRFDRTLFLDCDTLILAPFDDLFDILDRFELALTHDVRRATPLIREGYREKTPYAFPQMNSGVLLYRKSDRVQSFFAEWKERYVAAGQMRDQITLKDLLWASDIRFYVLPPEFNLRRVTMLDAWEPGDARPTILHSHRLLDHLRQPGAERLTDPEEIWAQERLSLVEEWAQAGVEGERNQDFGRLLSILGQRGES